MLFYHNWKKFYCSDPSRLLDIIIHSFPLLHISPLCKWNFLFIHWLSCWWTLEGFQVFIIVKNTAINTLYIPLNAHMQEYFLGTYLGVKLLGFYLLMSNSRKQCQVIFAKWLWLITLPQQCTKPSCGFIASPNLFLSVLLLFISLIVVLIFISLDENDIESLFICVLIGHTSFLFFEMAAHESCLFFQWIVLFIEL